jgi:hypothetical protein
LQQILNSISIGDLEGSGRLIMRHLSRMRNISSFWGYNHAVRLVTTTLILLSGLLLFEAEWQMAEELSEMDSFSSGWRGYNLTTAVLLYIVVWATAAAPGFANDYFFDHVLRKLAALADDGPNMVLDAPGQEVETDGGSKYVTELLVQKQVRITHLMQRIDCLSGRSGMHFAFVSMTTARAVSIGTVVAYLAYYITRVFTAWID